MIKNNMTNCISPLRYFQIRFKYLSTIWKEDFIVYESDTFPDDEEMEKTILNERNWIDRISVTSIKEISYEKYTKYIDTRSLNEEDE